VGGGAREHALCLALAADPTVTHVICAPGNAGTAMVAEQRALDPGVAEQVAGLAAEAAVDLVVIGPEVPLVAGAADMVRARGIACFGPSAAAARIEGSKAFAKEVMTAAGVPTARATPVLRDPADAAAALAQAQPPYVVKRDGLAAGKGVLVTGDRPAAEGFAAGHPVIVEEYLAGPELSLLCVTDGVTAVPLLPAQDFKRIGDGDTGPNTGGMGAYAPLDWAPPGLVDDVLARIVRPTLAELSARCTPFAGLLYAGLVLTADGPKVIEFNARFGDPETQVVLALLETPLAGLLHAAATGGLGALPAPVWRDGAAVTVVVAAEGYPGTPRVGDPIVGADLPGVLHAGTRRRDDGVVVSSGGRVLSVTATGATLAAARDTAYDLVGRVHLPGGQHRTDIALRAVRGQVVVSA